MIRLRPSGADEVLIKRVRDWYEPGSGVFIAPQAPFTPAALFTTGVNGVWYDPSDMTTLFQDAAGTLPVTAVEQSVGLMLDKSKGLVLGPELVTNGDFSNGTTGWALANTTVSASQLVFSGTVGSTATQSGVFSSGKNYKFTIDVSRAGGTLYILAGGNVVLTKTTAGNVSFIANNVSAGNLQFLSNDFIGSVDNISVRELPGNHAYNPTPVGTANFPVLQQDGTGRYYLAFNGGNQWLQTNSIDFTYGDKMFVSAGVRKLSDAAIGALLETSANSNLNNGAIWLLCPGSPALDQYSFRSKGTSASDVNVTGYAAPITNVLSGIGNISGDQAILRVNGAQAAISTGDQGTGNYGNYPLYIGARAGSSLWFNGRLHQLVVAGKQASASEIGQTEAFTNQKTGAY